MKIDFILPDIGEGIVECELVEWHVAEGEHIQEDQPVADVMTDKALVEITAMHTGTVSKLYCQKGDIAKVHEPLFEIEIASDNSAAGTTDQPAPTAAAPTPQTTQSNEPSQNSAPSLLRGHKTLASPAVRRIAREHNLDLAQVQGSGKDGRVLKEDLLPVVNGSTDASPHPKQPASTVSWQPSATDRTEPIKGIKAAMAKQMMDSASTIPHFTYVDEIDVTELDALRARLKESFAADGIKLSMMPFIMKAMALAIQHYPVLNSRVNSDCTELTYLADINIGMAADTPMGLLVPNVKGVQNLTLKDVAREVNRLTDAARAGRVAPGDMKSGTISISNIGALGGTVATPIINKPEVAIVALGRVQSLPRFAADGSVTARKIMQVSWSGDHRVIDGGTIARFCNQWKVYLEEPASMMADLR
ncbi:2-oxo acid dehydrogenase subunit E2 [Salinispirillum sp. LH 10-3-1]|uniref:Dihydrolipoamide acetyltransferase component of pyruvate dehydrogenase complex n=1 Tax=Salinispirillum sp. LH 10-3-1 TaxID=2952525 RepID=A0AB38YKH3_9GAMM